MSKYIATTPSKITEKIRAFCGKLVMDDPEFLDVQPEPTSDVGMCYLNAEATAKRLGATVVNGWLIWEQPGVYLTAERHGVVELNNKFLDVTPQSQGEKKVLFLPDRLAGSTPTPQANKYEPLVSHPLVLRFVELARSNSKLEMTGKMFGMEWARNDIEKTRLLDSFLARPRLHKERTDRRKKKKDARQRKKRSR